LSPIVKTVIPCHYANKSGRGQAACWLSLEVVTDLVEAGQAKWNKKHTYVNFCKTEASMTPGQPSCRMDEDIVFANACGDAAAMALVAAWQPIMVALPYAA
jgi:hypothetical protein